MCTWLKVLKILGYYQNFVIFFWQDRRRKGVLAVMICRTLGKKWGVDLFEGMDATKAKVISQAKADESGVTKYEYLCKGDEKTIFDCPRQEGKCPRTEDGKEWVAHWCMD